MNAGDTAWVLTSAALVLFMTVGLAFFYGGLEPSRNVLHMVAMNLFTIAVVTIVWAVIGFSLAFGPDAGAGLIGNLHYAGLANMGGVWPGTDIPKLVFMAFQLMFAIITPALITGALAGRLKFEAWIGICVGWSLVVYPVIAHWLFDPSGWIYKLGGRDFAGGAVVHISAGAAALVLVLMVGPRTKTAASSYRPNSIPLVMLGAGILWFGWFGFNAGSALGANQLSANAFVVTQIAAAAGFLVWTIIERWQTGKTTLVGAATGAIAGLAAITPAAGYVGPMPALAIGAAAALVCYLSARAVQKIRHFDDSFAVLSTHGAGGLVGMLAVGVFARYAINPSGLTASNGSHLNGLTSGHAALLGYQAIAIGAVFAFTVVGTFVVGLVVRATVGLRATTEQEELTGLNLAFEEDAAEQDESANLSVSSLMPDGGVGGPP
jgi:Amt family ammonium transporter